MAISEEARHELYQALERSIGHDQAVTLMGGLTFDERLEGRFAAIDARFERLSGQIDRQFGQVQAQFGEVQRQFGEMHLRFAEWGRTIVLANVATMVAAVSLAFAASRL